MQRTTMIFLDQEHLRRVLLKEIDSVEDTATLITYARAVFGKPDIAEDAEGQIVIKEEIPDHWTENQLRIYRESYEAMLEHSDD